MRKERKIAGKEEDYFVLCRRIENEKSFFQKHFFDDIQAGPIVVDTTPPQLGHPCFIILALDVCLPGVLCFGMEFMQIFV